MSESSPEHAPSGPLSGVKVVDFSNFIAGCYTAVMMGDLGADVVKVEPLYGDGARYWGPFLAGESRFFQGWNRSKRSISLDMRSDAGKEVVRKLLQEADIVVENFRAGVTKRLGIDYDTARELNAKIIYCSITAFGARGPESTRPGYDPILQSMSGAARANERYSGKACVSSVAMSDYGAGMLGAQGILAALYHRERTGEGQLIETSLLQAAMAMQNHMYCKPLDVEEEPPFGIYPYRLFETKDDLIFVAGPTDKFWKILCETIGAPELADDPRYKTNPDRVEQAEELTPKLDAIFSQKTTDEWLALLVEEGMPCGPVLSHDEFFELPQVSAMGMKQRVEHSVVGAMEIPGVPLDFEKTPGRIQRAAPALGEHTDQILAELGYEGAAIAQMRQDGLIA